MTDSRDHLLGAWLAARRSPRALAFISSVTFPCDFASGRATHGSRLAHRLPLWESLVSDEERPVRHITISFVLALSAGLAGCWVDMPTGPSFDLVAHAGADQVVECSGHQGAPVTLDGRASDTDEQPVTLEWRGSFGTVTGLQPTVTLPVGRHEITLIATDNFGRTSTDVVVVEVVDTRSPEISGVTAVPASLWPPNHKMWPVAVTVDVSDVCHATPACRIVSVTSNEPVNGLGDGNTEPDWRITGDLTMELRAERSGTGEGRVYTITVQCTDASGNSSAVRDVTVTVPHDQGKSPK